MRKTSVHDQHKFMEDKLQNYGISGDGVRQILEDFGEVNETMEGKMKKINIGHYEFFMIRLAARRGIEIRELTEDEVRKVKDSIL